MDYQNKPQSSTNPESQIFDYTVFDQFGEKVGHVNNLWPSSTGSGYSYIGVTTGWLFNQDHVVPAEGMRIDHALNEVHLPLSKETIKAAPDFEVSEDITDSQRNRISQYYGTGTITDRDRSFSVHDDTRTRSGASDVDVPIHEEKVNIGKREVQDGEVRLRRIVRTEQKNVPVELKREDVVVERVPASEIRDTDRKIGDKDITIPLKHEEAVVEKRTEVTGGVRVKKKTDVEHKNVSETIRKEDVEVDRSDDPKRR
jgi:uncharacterized protein (TIGR02271 family)